MQSHFVICFAASVNFSLFLPIYPSPYPSLHCHSYLSSVFLFMSVCILSLSTPSWATPFSSSPLPNHPLSLSFFAYLSHCACLLIILSPSPSPMMLKFSLLHQFALTVNCVENNSHCWAACPGLGFRQIGHDGKGRQPRNCATWENTEPVQDTAK